MMREKYTKPLIYFESFTLSQTIAKNCGDTHDSTLGESTHDDERTCVWDVGGVTIFFPDNYCDQGPDSPDDDFAIGGLCYNNPEGGAMIFSSM